MSTETFVTLRGWLGTDVTLRRAGETVAAHFRVACTPRRFNRRTGEWFDAGTQWYSVTAWRDLADNCNRSLRRSDPVVVHGRLNTSTWTTKDGEEVTTLELEATHVGHDLLRGTSMFQKTPKRVSEPLSPPPADTGEARPGDAAEGAEGAEGSRAPGADGWGVPGAGGSDDVETEAA